MSLTTTINTDLPEAEQLPDLERRSKERMARIRLLNEGIGRIILTAQAQIWPFPSVADRERAKRIMRNLRHEDAGVCGVQVNEGGVIIIETLTRTGESCEVWVFTYLGERCLSVRCDAFDERIDRAVAFEQAPYRWFPVMAPPDAPGLPRRVRAETPQTGPIPWAAPA